MKKTFKFLTCLFVAILCFGQMWGDAYTPTADEVIILNAVYSSSATDAGYSSHSAIAWGGSVSSTSSKKAGDPNNDGAATSSNVTCYSVKGNGGGKNITISITGCSKIIVYHESHASRYVELRSGSKSGTLIGKGSASTYYTEVNLTPATSYTIFLHGTTGSDDQDFNVYAVKLIKGSGGSETPVCPSGLSISGTTSYTAGQTISLSAALSAGNGTITYTWYKGADLATAKTAGSIGTSASFSKASCVEGDAGNYWCEATKDDCLAVSNASAYTVTVAAAKTVADLVAITDDWTFTPSATIAAGTMAESDKLFAAGSNDCDYSNGMRVKQNRALAFKVADKAKVKVTFTENGSRQIQLGSALSDGNYTTYGSSATSPYTFTVSTGGVVYLTASNDLRFSKLEIMYPHTVTYALNDGTGTTPTQASKYAGETFTAHDGTTGITAPAGKEFEKWKDQDNADVAAGATYTMPAKNVTLTAQWRTVTVKYTVTYDLDDYTAGVAPTETNKAENDVITIKAAPERASYDFLGWLCDIDAATYQAGDDYTMTAANTKFTAQWQAFFTITYKDGDETLGTEKVNAGDSPAGIADPTKELYSFVGWTLEGEDDLIDPTTLDASTTLFAKWVDFEGCAYLAPETSGDALTVGASVDLKSASFGGSVKVAGLSGSGKIAYNAAGLAFTGGGGDSIRVTLNNQMQVGTKISVYLQAGGTGSRGLKLQTLAKANVATLGWSSATQGAIETFTYTVAANDGLVGEKAFLLARNNTVYLKFITVEECAPQDFTVTYKDGASTMGTEYVIENEHPTASGIATRKNGYVFEGWAETDGGSVVDLDDITITADKTLYAVYSERVCATSGSMFKFQMKTDLTNGNVFASAPNSIAATTDNYLATLAGGEVTFAVTGTNNNRLQFYDGKAVGFGDGGSITVYLDCPLAENDEIRFINYASSGNSITLSDGTNSTTLDGNKSETVQTWSVPAAWAGAYELTMVRNAGTAKLTYFEIYRRPVLTSVSLEDLNLKVGATGTPVMTLNPEGALVTSQVWDITASTATGTTIDENTGLITAGETAGELTVQVTLNSDKVATCTVKVVPGFEAPKPVTGTTTWNWATLSVPTGDGPTIANPDTVLANYLSGEEWETLAGNAGGRPYRHNPNYMCYQGTKLSFKAAVPGILKIYAGSTGSDKKVYVNGYEVGTVTSTKAYLNKIVVPAGDVVITSESMRIYWMKFDTDLSAYTLEDNVLGGYDRTIKAGNYGTICLPNSGVMSGASIFEIAYYDEAQTKIFFDEVVNGYMVAGRPYIFLPNDGVNEITVYSTDNANAEAGNWRGLYGFFDTSEDDAIKKLEENDYFLYNNQYYVVDHAAVGLVAVGNYRAYIKLSDVDGYPSDPAPGRRRVSMNVNGKQVATDVENVTNANVPQKVLINGRMFIILGEKMYDVTGQIVK
jgi:uncharacterized repeat protein (TIGR02543 family)